MTEAAGKIKTGSCIPAVNVPERLEVAWRNSLFKISNSGRAVEREHTGVGNGPGKALLCLEEYAI